MIWSTLPVAVLLGAISAAMAYAHAGSLLLALFWFWLGAYAYIGIVAIVFWLTEVR